MWAADHITFQERGIVKKMKNATYIPTYADMTVDTAFAPIPRYDLMSCARAWPITYWRTVEGEFDPSRTASDPVTNEGFISVTQPTYFNGDASDGVGDMPDAPSDAAGDSSTINIGVSAKMTWDMVTKAARRNELPYQRLGPPLGPKPKTTESGDKLGLGQLEVGEPIYSPAFPSSPHQEGCVAGGDGCSNAKLYGGWPLEAAAGETGIASWGGFVSFYVRTTYTCTHQQPASRIDAWSAFCEA